MPQVLRLLQYIGNLSTIIVYVDWNKLCEINKYNKNSNEMSTYLY